ncbi:MAG: type II toxin-antitoxin system RelE/ParE family toxin, partial [Kiloniellales bacterium]|nr:type II toxin-antitoxin system RelE/ParE family toxin [Kiloniellales bacterium]
DLDRICEDLLAEQPSVALQILDRIEGRVEALRDQPGLGRPGRVAGTRELVVSGLPFIIPYRVKAGRIEVIRALHAARLWPERFG